MSTSILAHGPVTHTPRNGDQRSQFEREVRIHLHLQLLRPMTAGERQLLAAAVAAK